MWSDLLILTRHVVSRTSLHCYYCITLCLAHIAGTQCRCLCNLQNVSRRVSRGDLEGQGVPILDAPPWFPFD